MRKESHVADAECDARSRRARERRDYERAMATWKARDVYRVQNFLIGCGLLLGLAVLLGVLLGVAQLLQ
jgi:hypothetical protein